MHSLCNVCFFVICYVCLTNFAKIITYKKLYEKVLLAEIAFPSSQKPLAEMLNVLPGSSVTTSSVSTEKGFSVPLANRIASIDINTTV